MHVLVDVSDQLVLQSGYATYQNPKPNTTISNIFCCLDMGRVPTSGKGSMAVAKSVAALTPAAE